jgi:hypothetical protein
MLAVPTLPKEIGWTADKRLSQPASQSVTTTDAHENVALDEEGSLSENSHIEQEY